MLSKFLLILEFLARMSQIFMSWQRMAQKKKDMQVLKDAYQKAKESGSTKGLSQWLNSR